MWLVELFICWPVSEVYRDGCWNVVGKLSSEAELLVPRLGQAMHALINIAATEAV